MNRFNRFKDTYDMIFYHHHLLRLNSIKGSLAKLFFKLNIKLPSTLLNNENLNLDKQLHRQLSKNNFGFLNIKFSPTLFNNEKLKQLSPEQVQRPSSGTNLPELIKPYLKLARLHAPIGTWLLFWPCAWSITLAAQPTTLIPSAFYLGCCAAGAILMRSSGCVINDLWDRDLDGKVERTSDRPIASGQVTIKQALIFLGAQLGLSLAILMQFQPLTILLGLSSMGLVIIYPLMKRIFNWPQLVLGLTFNWGALLGWTAVSGAFSPPFAVPICLYASGICWTLVYDSIYAHQDKDDDIKIGIRSTALNWGEQNKLIMSIFASLMTLSLIGVGYSGELNWPYYLSIFITASSLFWTLKTVNLNDKTRCGEIFKNQKWIGLIIFLGILSSKGLMWYNLPGSINELDQLNFITKP